MAKKRRKAEISEDQVRKFFHIIKNSDKLTRERDWLIFKLIYRYGLKPGEVAGNVRQHSRVPGIAITDLVPERNAVIVHKGAIAGFKVYRLSVEPEDMKRLLQYKGEKTEGKLFDIDADSVNYFFHQYAKQASFPRDASPEILRTFYKPPEIERRYYRYLSEIESDIVEASLDMANHYVVSFCIENTVRRLILRTLDDKYDKDWWKTKVPSDIQQYAEERQREERETTRDIRSDEPLNYTTFGHLKVIIDVNWTDFEDKIRSRGSIDKALSGLGEFRNIIAHSGTLSKDDKEKFDMAVRDWRRVQSPN